MNQSEYTYLQNKNFRALSYDWEALSNNGGTVGLYCLSEFQVAWLLSNTEYIRWSTRWIDCPCSQSDLDAIKAELDYNLMNCLDFQPWQLDSIYNDANNQAMDRYESNWDGANPSSVNPNAPDDYFNGDDSPDRNNALCSAILIYMYSYAQSWITQAERKLGVLSFFANFADNLLGVGGLIPVFTFTDLLDPMQSQVDAMKDQTSIEIVACDWANALEGEAFTAGNWTDGLAGLSYAPETNMAIIQEILAPDTEILGNFLSFIDSIGDMFPLEQRGISICPCPDVWTHTFDFTVDNGGFVNAGGLTGVYVASTGWRAQDDGTNETRLYIVKSGLPEFHLTNVSATMTFTGDTSVAYSSLIFMTDDGSGGLDAFYNNTSFGNANTSFNVDVDYTCENFFRLQLYRSGFLPAPAPINTIVTLTLSGTGDNPF